MPIKSVKMKISKNKKMRFFLMSQGSLNPKMRFLGQKVLPVARARTDRRTDTKVTTEGTLSGFQEFFLQPIIKERPKIINIRTFIHKKKILKDKKSVDLISLKSKLHYICTESRQTSPITRVDSIFIIQVVTKKPAASECTSLQIKGR